MSVGITIEKEMSGEMSRRKFRGKCPGKMS